MICAQHLAYSYGKKKVLEDVTFQLPLGKIIGLVGENGSGKSTLLRLLAGVKTPSKGIIQMDGSKITHQSASNIAYLPDIDEFYPYLTGSELFEFYTSQFDDFSMEKAIEVSEFMQVEIHQKMKKLSKGQRGRIKMAATLGRNVSYYFMDEPFSGLDPMVRESLIKGLIKFLDEKNQTIFLSTHELHEVEPILDAILLLKDGRVDSFETLEDVREEWQEDAVQWMKKQYRKG
ncbi:ATP-binding cassette domain-containing protein [Rummeliibacillus pycnus]|uniref:ABC transporter ATP-binding protein n=1 Tax=Rummeliibacillus pycnus TaxID=101070 RepID=UPI003D2A620C